MDYLHHLIEHKVQAWRDAGYPCEPYPAIAEILEFQSEELGDGRKVRRFLRSAQCRALETYWYLRLVEGTPHVFDLYQKHYGSNSSRLEALGLSKDSFRDFVMDHGIEALWDRIREDDGFVKDFKLEALHETLTLQYPSYIFALAMGAGKTILIGAIIASEYAMAMEYPDGPFVQNALVFAPGTTIIESLREIADIPFEAILPTRMAKRFIANLKLTFTRDGDPDVPVIPGSFFNLVVTNTEKIRIQKNSIRKGDLGGLIPDSALDEAFEATANRRLRTIASLPHLAVFSDEAHHTYGKKVGERLKRVRQTVDYLYEKSPNLICVVNTTGTPYFERQPLRDVVIWYGLSQGIRDGILKEVAENIYAYEFDSDDAAQFVSEVVRDFFETYGEITLSDGCKAKLALYFPQNDDLDDLRPHIERTLIGMGYGADMVLRNTSESTEEEIRSFNRLNEPESEHRVILLVNKGTEGWNCPSLFACALARKLKSSNNFVLQAASRCLRQVPGNDSKARIYLSQDNRAILDKQLQETFGESLSDLDRSGRETRTAILRLRKIDIPPVVITKLIRTVEPKADAVDAKLHLEKPGTGSAAVLRRTILTISEQAATDRVLAETGHEEAIDGEFLSADPYSAAVRLADMYRLDMWALYDELKRLYGSEDIPLNHLGGLGEQIESLTCNYTVKEEMVDVALALVKPEGFTRTADESGVETYTAEIVYLKEREDMLLRLEDIADNPGDFGFHYTPYNFDSNLEKSYCEKLLRLVNRLPEEVEDIYFTGAITDPKKTDFFVEYRDEKGKWRRYTPDFVIRLKGVAGEQGKCLIIELKGSNMRDDPIQGENGKKAMAIKKWEELRPAELKYEMIFGGHEVTARDMGSASDFIGLQK